MKIVILIAVLTIVKNVCGVALSPLLSSRSISPQQCNSTEGIIKGCSDDCKGLNFCLNNQLITIDCFAQTSRAYPYCNETSLTCVASSNECKTPQKFYCPSADGLYPHPLDCHYFYNCINGKAELHECINSVFSSNPPSCRRDVYCFQFSRECEGKMGQFVVNPADESLFAYCQEFPIVSKCFGTNMKFDLKTLDCNFDCPEAGIFEDSLDITYFYSCIQDGTGFKVEHRRCPAYYIFDKNTLSCVPLIP